MIPASPRPRLLAVALLLSSAIVACGGGGGGSSVISPAPLPMAGVPPGAPGIADPVLAGSWPSASSASVSGAAERFLLAGTATSIAAGGSAAARLVVFDPSAPATTVRSEPLGHTSVDRVLVTTRRQLGPGHRQAGFVGHPKVFYLQEGRVLALSLRVGAQAAPAPSPVTMLTDVCGLLRALEFDFAAADHGWLEVERAGPDGACDRTPDNPRSWVRSDTGAVVSLPAGLEVIDVLRDPDGTLTHLLALDRATATLRLLAGSSLASVGGVEGGHGIASIARYADEPGEAAARFYKVDGRDLRRLTWAASGATLGPVLHRLAGTDGGGISDGEHLFVADGPVVWRVAAGAAAATPHARLDAAAGDIRELGLTDTRVLVTQGGLRPRLLSVDKSDGTQTTVFAGGPGDSGLYLFTGSHGDVVTYADVSGPGGVSARLFRTAADRVPVAPWLTGVALVGSLVDRHGAFGLARTDSLVVCAAPAAGADDCRGGAVQQWSIETGQGLSLGRLPAFEGAGALGLSAAGWAPGPVLLHRTVGGADGTPEGLQQDLFTFEAGVAVSLARVTAFAP